MTTFTITLDADEATATRALKWCLRVLLRSFGVRVVSVRPIANPNPEVTA